MSIPTTVAPFSQYRLHTLRAHRSGKAFRAAGPRGLVGTGTLRDRLISDLGWRRRNLAVSAAATETLKVATPCDGDNHCAIRTRGHRTRRGCQVSERYPQHG